MEFPAGVDGKGASFGPGPPPSNLDLDRTFNDPNRWQGLEGGRDGRDGDRRRVEQLMCLANKQIVFQEGLKDVSQLKKVDVLCVGEGNFSQDPGRQFDELRMHAACRIDPFHKVYDWKTINTSMLKQWAATTTERVLIYIVRSTSCSLLSWVSGFSLLLSLFIGSCQPVMFLRHFKHVL